MSFKWSVELEAELLKRWHEVKVGAYSEKEERRLLREKLEAFSRESLGESVELSDAVLAHKLSDFMRTGKKLVARHVTSRLGSKNVETSRGKGRRFSGKSLADVTKKNIDWRQLETECGWPHLRLYFELFGESSCPGDKTCAVDMDSDQCNANSSGIESCNDCKCDMDTEQEESAVSSDDRSKVGGNVCRGNHRAPAARRPVRRRLTFTNNTEDTDSEEDRCPVGCDGTSPCGEESRFSTIRAVRSRKRKRESDGERAKRPCNDGQTEQDGAGGMSEGLDAAAENAEQTESESEDDSDSEDLDEFMMLMLLLYSSSSTFSKFRHRSPLTRFKSSWAMDELLAMYQSDTEAEDLFSMTTMMMMFMMMQSTMIIQAAMFKRLLDDRRRQ